MEKKRKERATGIPTDAIADMLTRIRNASSNKSESVYVPLSKMKLEIAKILKAEGYILDFKEKENKETKHKNIKIYLKYVENQSAIVGIKRISSPGRRVYAESADLPKVLNGLGIAVVSTNRGIITDKKAKELGIGGEVLAFVW